MRRAAVSPTRRARMMAWGGTFVFGGSLLYGAYSYVVTFARPVSAGAAAAAVVDTLLFTAFALHHSVFAREPIRGRVARLVSPALERSLYVWIASLTFVAVCAAWQPVAGVAWTTGGPLWWGLAAAQAAGVWLTVRSATIIDVLELSGVRQLEAPSHPIEFKTTGPYGWMRHPIYTGWFLMVFASPTMTATQLVFAAVSSAYLLVAIPLEERSLVATTSGAYERYAKQVRWKLVPGIY